MHLVARKGAGVVPYVTVVIMYVCSLASGCFRHGIFWKEVSDAFTFTLAVHLFDVGGDDEIVKSEFYRNTS